MASLWFPSSSEGFANDLSADFSTNNNPNGAWAYGFKNISQSPTNFTAFADSYGGYLGSVGYWNGISQYADGLPAIGKNYSGSDVFDGPSTYIAQEVFGHPGLTRDFVVQWTAPSNGLYSLNSFYRGLSASGTSTDVSIFDGLTLLYSNSVNGYLTVLTAPQLDLSLVTGEKISFIVNNRGDYFNDTTGISATFVSVIPESGSLSLICLGLIALAKARRHASRRR